MSKLGPLPPELFAVLERELTSAHHDENAGVPIGARCVAIAVLKLFDDPDKHAGLLRLGKPWDIPSEWAAEHCLNPVRRGRS